MRVEAFRPEHIAKMTAMSPSQKHQVEALTAEELAALTARGEHYSLFEGEELIACFGAVPMNRFRASGWTLLCNGRPELFRELHRTLRRLLFSLPYNMIEVYVNPDDVNEIRWVRLLGFQLQAPFKPYYYSDGRGAAEYALFLK